MLRAPRRAFTLVELLVVIAVIVVAILIPSIVLAVIAVAILIPAVRSKRAKDRADTLDEPAAPVPAEDDVYHSPSRLTRLTPSRRRRLAPVRQQRKPAPPAGR